MTVSRRTFLQRGGAVATLIGVGMSLDAKADEVRFTDPTIHLLNRLTYGPRPHEVAKLNEIGAEAFLAEQLNPQQIDDAEADARLAQHPILHMDRHTIYRLQHSEGRAYKSLIQGMLARAVYSKRQLLERMVEFWSDHFNVPADFDNTNNIVLFQRDVRKHALGNFRDLLLATAKSPAMLYYLDNYVNFKESPNENYARELMELHTLGVDGGYSEEDVKEVARAFTGWTIHDETESGFYFNQNEHDTATKTVLGHVLPAERGIEDGLHVLGMLANHPSTAQFVCRKLCVRFVSDRPPETLVESLAKVWLETRGDIKAILRSLFLSEEFGASGGQKLRRPLDFFIGAARATGTQIHDWWKLERMLKRLGQVPYGWHPPNGYPDVAGAWMNTGGVLARWNAAMQLSHGAYSDPDWGYGMTTDLRERIPEVGTVAELAKTVSQEVFGAALPQEKLEPFIHFASDGAGPDEPVTVHLLGRKLGSLYGLMLASPEFQWR